MLEYSSLLVRRAKPEPFQPPTEAAQLPAAALFWTICDLETGDSLGCARGNPGAGRGWRRWLSRPMLAVYETEDFSLLCTLNRPWLLPIGWEVCDADGRRVGSLRGSAMWDRFGLWLANVEDLHDGSGSRFLDGDRQELGAVVIDGDEMRLTFAARLDADPFTKMVLLTTTLFLDAARAG